jgi:histone acetyltransferase 1
MILPPYQRQGHGGRLYNAVWRYSLEHPRVADISIEDPIIDFSRYLLAH